MEHFIKIQEIQSRITIACAENRNRIYRQKKRGKLETLFSGCLIDAAFYKGLPPWDQALARAIAFGMLENNFVLSHQSAARIHGFGVLDIEKEVHVRTNTRQSTVDKGVIAHCYRDVVEKMTTFNIHLTDPVQTVIDCARFLPTREAAAIVDSALKRIPKSIVEERLDEMRLCADEPKVSRVLEVAAS